MLKKYLSYIGLGANLNNPRNQIQTAFIQLNQTTHIQLLKQSSLYSSRPIGPPQPNYINAAALICTTLDAFGLLSELQQIEALHDRVRNEHWGPRTLDLDLLLYENEIIQTPQLKVPHPELKNRPFVIWPLYEIAPELILPDQTPLRSLTEKKLAMHEKVTLLP